MLFPGNSSKSPAEMDAFLNDDPRRCYVEGVRFMKEQGLKVPEVLVEERHETFDKTINAVRQAGFGGLVLIIDELSEFFRSKPDARGLNEDAQNPPVARRSREHRTDLDHCRRAGKHRKDRRHCSGHLSKN